MVSRRHLAAVMIGAALLCTTAVSSAATPPAFVATVDAFHASMQKGDAEGVASLLTDDAVIFEQGGAENSKDEYVTGHLPGDIAYSAGMKDEIVSRRSEMSGDVAMVLTQGRTTGTYEGKPVDRLTTETMVLKRVKGTWRIVHIHWSSRAAPAR